MKKIIISLFCLLLIPSIFAKIELQAIYSIQMEIFKDDNVILQSISADNGIISSFPTFKTDYSIKILGPKNNVLFDKNIGVSFTLIREPLKEVQLKSTIVNIKVPYLDNAERIVVYHFNKEIFNIDLSKKICNDNLVCEIGENKYNCPGDCKETKKISFWVFGIVSILILVSVYFLFKKLRK